MATARIPKGSRQGGQFTDLPSADQIPAGLALGDPPKGPAVTVRSEIAALPLSLARTNGQWSVTEELVFTPIGSLLASLATEDTQSKVAYRYLLSHVLANYANQRNASEAHIEAILSAYGIIYETGGSAANLPTAVREGVIDTLLSVTENLSNVATDPIELDSRTRYQIVAHGFPGDSVADLAKRKVVTGLFTDILRSASHPGPFSAAAQSKGRYRPESAAVHYDRCHALRIEGYANGDPLSMDHRVLLLLSKHVASSDAASFQAWWRADSPINHAISSNLVVPFVQVLRSADHRDITTAINVLHQARTMADEDAANGGGSAALALSQTVGFLSSLERATDAPEDQQRFQRIRHIFQGAKL